MLLTALALFVAAAFGGITLLYIKETGKELPYWLAGLHGVLAASGVILLTIAIMANPGKIMAMAALGIFILAALGGAYLLSLHLRKQPQPLPFIIGHGVIALIGIGLLIIAMLY